MHDLQTAFDQTAFGRGPGLFALVADAGEVVFTASSGTADLVEPRPIEPGDRFRIASISKTFTATLVLQLIADRLLALEDSAVRWLPQVLAGLVPEDWPATIGQLLAMKSGLPDYVPALIGDPPNVDRIRRRFTPEELIALAAAQPRMQPPGTAWRYSNAGYLILGLIAEQVTGRLLPDLLAERIFRPLGMTATYLPLTDTGIEPPHAHGYLRLTEAGGYTECTEFDPSECWAAGAIISTPVELARFLEALLAGRLLPPDQLAAMRVMSRAGTGHLEYGLGLARWQLSDGTALYGHGGTHFGVNCLAFGTDTGRTAVVYQNSCDRVTGGLRVDNPFIQRAFGAARSETKAGICRRSNRYSEVFENGA
jgi:D-alanyl-D-alanine carboxypeptidase